MIEFLYIYEHIETTAQLTAVTTDVIVPNIAI